MIDLLSRLGSFELLEAPWARGVSGPSWLRPLRRRRAQRDIGAGLAAGMAPSRDAQALFFAIALTPNMVSIAAETIRARGDTGSHKVLYIDENIEPDDVAAEHWGHFDHIVCFCADLAAQIAEATGVPTSYWPPHLDLLRFHSTDTYRPIDLICFGRSRTDILFEMQRRFLDPTRSALCMDFVTRTQPDRTQPAEAEFRLLFDTLRKSRASLCFPPDDVPRFKGRSPLLARWLYAWAAGCAVFGTRPRSVGAQPHMDWREATVTLPEDVDAAGDLIDAALADGPTLRRHGLINASEALSRHDTRQRLQALFATLDLTFPVALQAELAQLSELAKSVRDAAD
ncbi:MAG: hypothetical protein AAF919_02640 [Pseudomonadota bacterium]